MAVTKSREELVRLSWLTELRRQGHRKCEGLLHGDGAEVCALGLLAEVGGMSRADARRDVNYANIRQLAGLSIWQCNSIWALNDGDKGNNRPKHNFAEIADVVAGWFPS